MCALVVCLMLLIVICFGVSFSYINFGLVPVVICVVSVGLIWFAWGTMLGVVGLILFCL